MDMAVSPAGLVDRVVLTHQAQAAQDAHIRVLAKAKAKAKAMDMQASGASALLNAVASQLPLASEAALGTRVNVLV